MTVVLNELKQVKQILSGGEIGSKPSATLFILGRYYRNTEGLDEDRTAEKLNEFMQKYYANYNSASWEGIIESIAVKSSKYPLRNIDCIFISKQELDTIRNIKNLKYEKLAFTMLCFAKLYNTVSAQNHGWINTKISEVFRSAGVTVKHRNDKFLYLNDLYTKGLISFSKSNTNLNLRINFIDDRSEPEIAIDDFRKLGNEYLQYIGKGTFLRCHKCGVLIKKTSNNQMYCTNCAKIMNVEKQRDRNKQRMIDSENSRNP